MMKNGVVSYSQDAVYGRIGENIYGAFAPGVLEYTPHTASSYWYKESSNYDYVKGEAKEAGQEIWEFTSMIWKGVKEVGFGYAYGPGTISGHNGTLIYIVAKYSPTPNVVGEFTNNIGQPGQNLLQ